MQVTQTTRPVDSVELVPELTVAETTRVADAFTAGHAGAGITTAPACGWIRVRIHRHYGPLAHRVATFADLTAQLTQIDEPQRLERYGHAPGLKVTGEFLGCEVEVFAPLDAADLAEIARDAAYAATSL